MISAASLADDEESDGVRVKRLQGGEGALKLRFWQEQILPGSYSCLSAAGSGISMSAAKRLGVCSHSWLH